jgi:hypothetical protein
VADDTRKPDDDDTVDPPTGEHEVPGADWLISQLDAAPTGQFDTRQIPAGNTDPDAPQRPGRAGDNPVLAWWRDKLVAADALVNPEVRPTVIAPDAADVAKPTKATEATEATEAGEHPAAADVPDDADVTVDADASVDAAAPSPAEPESVPAEEEPVEAFLPEPAFTPEAEWAPVFRRSSADDTEDDDDDAEAVDAEAGDDREPVTDLRDEAETGVLPSIEPPLFQPRSARDRLDEEKAEEHAPVRASDDEPDDDFPTPAFPSLPGRAQESEDDEDADSDNTSEYVTEDLDNFSWKLTANDRLDPWIHRPEEPTAAGDSDDGTATRRQARFEAEQAAPPEPVIIPTPEAPGPRRRTFALPGTDAASPAIAPVRAPLRPARPAPKRAPRPVILAAIGVVALLVLGGLFFLGSQLPGLLAGPAATPTAAPSPTATPTPTAPAAPVGPAAAGEQQWTALGGGECLEPYTTPWAETFTVVDCAEPHSAQLVFTGAVDDDPAAAYPGEETILSRIYLWCTAPGVLDAAAAGEYTDLQVQGSYPVSEEQWADGQRNYSCFVNRSSGEPLTGSVAAAAQG